MKKLLSVSLVFCLVCSFMPVANVFATNARDLNFGSLSPQQFVEKMGPVFTEDQKNTGILASVSLAQCIIESGWGKSELAQKANNLFGMKFRLSGVDWTGRGYRKSTQEFVNGSYVDVTADFRAYDSIEDSIRDHSNYLLSCGRYPGLKGCKDYKEAASILKNGGYATDPEYVNKICSKVEQYGLSRFDIVGGSGSAEVARGESGESSAPDTSVKSESGASTGAGEKESGSVSSSTGVDESTAPSVKNDSNSKDTETKSDKAESGVVSGSSQGGSQKVTGSVSKSNSGKGTETGDTTEVFALYLAVLISVVAIAALVYNKRRRFSN